MAIFANMKRIILITGGERSGKSVYAEQLALRLSEQPVYMATARIWDEEFRHRVRIRCGPRISFSTIRRSRALRSRPPPTPWKADRLKPESGK